MLIFTASTSNKIIMTPDKLLPYGISDFKQLRREGKYYVDKTTYLPMMEDCPLARLDDGSAG
jgi:hypothetical protein